MMDRTGQQLGNYLLLRFLGRGGFADVYLGEHVYLKTRAAIKVLQVLLAGGNETFLSEARIIASLTHPHIVRVLDFGLDNGTPFLVMDYAANGSLRQHYQRGSRVPLSNIVTWVKQVAEALQYAHDRKLIHRDVKPENMLIGANNEVLLSDFGIAVIAQSTRYGNTQEVAGTIAYMAPEQIQGKPQPASDQYALGIVVYEWLTGDRPFQGSFAEVASQHMFASPPPLREKVPDVPGQIEQAVMIALGKEPQRRFSNVVAFAHALEQASRSEPFSSDASTFIRPVAGATSNIVPSFTQPANVSPTTPTLSPTRQSRAAGTPRISRRAMIMGLAGLTIGGGGIITWLYTRESSGTSPGPASSPTSAVTNHKVSSTTPTPESTNATSPTSVPAAPLPLIYRGHSNQVYTVAWSPNGFRIASGGKGDIIQVWDAGTGKEYLAYQGHSDRVYGVAWSPLSTSIASGHYDATVQVWNASTGKLLFVYRGHSSTYKGGLNWINTVAWSPDGTRIASGSHDTTVQICDASQGNPLLTYQGHSSFVNAVAWSPRGTYIASCGGDTTVQVWNANDATLHTTYHGHTDVVVDLAWSPDGKYIVSGGVDKMVRVWNVDTGETLRIYQGHAKTVNAVGWSPDGTYIASGGDDTSVQIWNASTAGLHRVYSGHTDVVQALAWSPDSGRVASASNDKTVQICSAS